MVHLSQSLSSYEQSLPLVAWRLLPCLVATEMNRQPCLGANPSKVAEATAAGRNTETWETAGLLPLEPILSPSGSKAVTCRAGPRLEFSGQENTREPELTPSVDLVPDHTAEVSFSLNILSPMENSAVQTRLWFSAAWGVGRGRCRNALVLRSGSWVPGLPGYFTGLLQPRGLGRGYCCPLSFKNWEAQGGWTTCPNSQ